MNGNLKKRSKNSSENRTARMMVTLTTDLIDTLKQKSVETFGNRKGALSLYVEMLLRNSLELSSRGVDET